MHRIPIKIRLWFFYKRVVSINYSELITIMVAVLLSISLAYPQINELNSNGKRVKVEFKHISGEITAGEVVIKQEGNTTLEILSIIGIILGPIILFWKFFIETKSIDKLYNKIHDELEKEFQELNKKPSFVGTSEKKAISDLFLKISNTGRIEKKMLFQLKYYIVTAKHLN